MSCTLVLKGLNLNWIYFTFISSGRFVSARFSWSFFWIESRVTSTAGLADLSDRSCFLSSSFSSWEPKLLGRVLLRWRTTGPRSSSDIFSFDSKQGHMGHKRSIFSFFKMWQWQKHCPTSNLNKAKSTCPQKVHQWWLLTFKLFSEFGQIICPFEHFRVGCFVTVGRLRGKKQSCWICVKPTGETHWNKCMSQQHRAWAQASDWFLHASDQFSSDFALTALPVKTLALRESWDIFILRKQNPNIML